MRFEKTNRVHTTCNRTREKEAEDGGVRGRNLSYVDKVWVKFVVVALFDWSGPFRLPPRRVLRPCPPDGSRNIFCLAHVLIVQYVPQSALKRLNGKRLTIILFFYISCNNR